MQEEVRRFGSYTVRAVKDKPDSVHVDFEIHEGEEVSHEPRCICYVKWDGCSNWHFEGDHFQMHFCEFESVADFGRLMPELYKWAAELMPENSKEILYVRDR